MGGGTVEQARPVGDPGCVAPVCARARAAARRSARGRRRRGWADVPAGGSRPSWSERVEHGALAYDHSTPARSNHPSRDVSFARSSTLKRAWNNTTH